MVQLGLSLHVEQAIRVKGLPLSYWTGATCPQQSHTLFNRPVSKRKAIGASRPPNESLVSCRFDMETKVN